MSCSKYCMYAVWILLKKNHFYIMPRLSLRVLWVFHPFKKNMDCYRKLQFNPDTLLGAKCMHTSLTSTSSHFRTPIPARPRVPVPPKNFNVRCSFLIFNLKLLFYFLSSCCSNIVRLHVVKTIKRHGP